MKWFLHVLKNTFNYKGRARRAEYGWFILVNVLIQVAASIAVMMLTVPMVMVSSDALFSTFIVVLDVISWIYSVIIFLAGCSLTARRLHDLGYSGWWQLGFILLPLLGLLLVFILGATGLEINENNPNAMGLVGIICVITGIVMLVFGLILLFKDGQRFTNKYGADPKAISSETANKNQTLIH